MQKTPTKFLISTVLLILFAIPNLLAQEGVVIVNQDKQIDALLKLKKDINRTEANYKIQIYNGDREGAEKSRIEFRKSFSDWSTNMKYETPNYKIWIGNFKTRLEADRALLKVKKKFRNAFIFKPKTEKKKS
ncbi:SPOR domain-containing protein [Olleya sp. AH-315-F22]|nr:SPOR domain-containing protein [Olleya sp. AH-315-F22]